MVCNVVSFSDNTFALQIPDCPDHEEAVRIFVRFMRVESAVKGKHASRRQSETEQRKSVA